jgi:hypothetical protein
MKRPERPAFFVAIFTVLSPSVRMLRKLLKPFWVFLALLFLLEAWLWDLLVPPIRRLIEWIGWSRIKYQLSLWLTDLPRWLIVCVFVLPDTVLLPVKLAGLWLVTQGHVIIGMGLFVMAKTLSLGVTVLLFELCRERLLELAWFRWIYEKIEAIRVWARLQIDPFVAVIRAMIAPTRSRILRIMERIRERMWRKRS